ncbi:hypothetical protein DY000_02020339 [Brassica cretica]|uniref:Uncharacterized protein n=1 Tax=Brassica cretica TaxID=69181 RepID=A0ABQ7E963_BRACR|nr:hypothetical protein DY000_02020339 [Brassica cretica]
MWFLNTSKAGVLSVLEGRLEHSQGRMAVRCTEGIEGCRAKYVLTGLGVINDWFWNASKAGVLSILDGWLETKPSLFVHGHVGMVG